MEHLYPDADPENANWLRALAAECAALETDYPRPTPAQQEAVLEALGPAWQARVWQQIGKRRHCWTNWG